MKAITRTSYGLPNILKIEEVEKPIPKKGEVLIKIMASTINRTDCAILTGKPFVMRFFMGLFKPSSLSPGTDFSGIIEAIGEGVDHFKVGEKVWGFNDQGLATHRQYTTMKADKDIVPMLDHLSFEEAVACAEGAHYAYNTILKSKIPNGSKVLINGATGAIGSALLQLLKAQDCSITAVANTKNLDLMKSLGADKVINYEREDFTKDTLLYDYVFDAVGKSSYRQCKPLLRQNGIYISSELGPGAENLYLPLTTKLFGSKRVVFPFPSNCHRTLLHLNTLLKERKFQAIIDRIYPPSKIQEAYTYVMSGQKTGNVIINFDVWNS